MFKIKIALMFMALFYGSITGLPTKIIKLHLLT